MKREKARNVLHVAAVVGDAARLHGDAAAQIQAPAGTEDARSLVGLVAVGGVRGHDRDGEVIVLISVDRQREIHRAGEERRGDLAVSNEVVSIRLRDGHIIVELKI